MPVATAVSRVREFVASQVIQGCILLSRRSGNAQKTGNVAIAFNAIKMMIIVSYLNPITWSVIIYIIHCRINKHTTVKLTFSHVLCILLQISKNSSSNSKHNNNTNNSNDNNDKNNNKS